jgi:hypothetical protein
MKWNALWRNIETEQDATDYASDTTKQFTSTTTCELYIDGVQKRKEIFFLLLRVCFFFSLLFFFSRVVTRATHYMTASSKTHTNAQPKMLPSKLVYKENKLWSYSLLPPSEAPDLRTSQLVSGVLFPHLCCC